MTSSPSVQRVTVSAASQSTSLPLSSGLRSSINTALVANHSIPVIQATLLHECQASGFSSALRTRVLELLRNGECTNFGEVMETVMSELKSGGISTVNGSGNDNEANGISSQTKLKIPRSVLEEGIKVVRAALEACVDFTGAD